MGFLILQLMLFQADPVRGTEFAQNAMKQQAVVERHSQTAEVSRQQKDFKQRFNTLVEAVAAFAQEYNQGQGQVWPAKKAEALRNAMKALEEADVRLKK